MYLPFYIVSTQTLPRQPLLHGLQGALRRLPHRKSLLTQHLASPNHARLLQASPFYQDVLDLCGRFQSNVMPAKGKKIQKKRKSGEKSREVCERKRERQKSMESSSTGVQSQPASENLLILGA